MTASLWQRVPQVWAKEKAKAEKLAKAKEEAAAKAKEAQTPTDGDSSEKAS